MHVVPDPGKRSRPAIDPVKEQVKDEADLCRLIIIDAQNAAMISGNVVVSDRRRGSADVVARLSPADPAHRHPLRDLIPLQLREDRQNPDHGFAEGGLRIEVLIHADQADPGRIEDILDQMQRVFLRPRESVQLVN